MTLLEQIEQENEGIGERTALTLLVRMPELGALSRGQVAALAGTAPFTHKSGRRDGQTHLAGGRGRRAAVARRGPPRQEGRHDDVRRAR